MFKSVNEGLLPEAQGKYSAGYDVFANNDAIIYPGEMKRISLGFKLDLSEYGLNNFENYFFGIYLRDSLAQKGTMLVNGVGVIHIDSSDEITIHLSNPIKDGKGYENKNLEIKKGDNIGQIILQKNHGKIMLGNKYRKA